jgi:Viral BACON domain/Abnormal spindle-like microcephaly-assoc'd, ASPM-SPD-2-Hydin/Kre9/KNH-like N-terminal Ig-like domain
MKMKTSFRFAIISALCLLSLSLSCQENPVKETNQAPSIPVVDVPSGAPPHGSDSRPISQVLRWKCVDPDGDTLLYDVYFGTASTPPLRIQKITVREYTPSDLQYDTTYYWKIVAHDGKGATSESPVWQFTTMAQPIETVSTPSSPSGPSAGNPGESLIYVTGGASSSLGHDIQYRFDWGDSNLSAWNVSETAFHIWSKVGSYAVRAQSRCSIHNDKVSSWSQNKTVTIVGPIVPMLSVFPTELDFDSTKTNLTFTIDNKGNGALNWFNSVNQSWMTLDVISGSTTFEIDRIAVSVDRTGLSVGTHAGIVTISSNGGNSVIEVSLEVKGNPALCSIFPQSLDFDSVEVGETKDLSFTITNVGGGNLSGSLSELCDDYSIVSGSNSYNLTSGQSQSVTIRYAPDKIKTDSCAIIVSPSCDNVICSGTGFVPPICVLDLSHLDFGTVQIGQEAELSLTVENQGGGILSGVVSEDCSDFSIVSGGSYSLGNGESQTVTVQFKPTSTGVQTCAIKMGSNCIDISSIAEGVPAECIVSVSSPAKSEIWTKGTQQTIRWNKDNCSAPDVDILFSKGLFSGGVILGTIAKSTPNDGLYDWTVDEFGGGTYSDYHIFVVDSLDITSGGYSAAFTVLNNDPVTITLNATADADIIQNLPDINVGTSQLLLVGKVTGDGFYGSFVRFSGLLSSVPSGATIISAELILTRRFWDGSLTMQVTPTKRNWLESTITWNTQPGEVSSTQTRVNPNGGGNPSQIRIDVTQHVQEWVDDVRPNYGFAMWSYGATNFEDVVQFYARESSTSSYHPKLTIVYKSP